MTADDSVESTEVAVPEGIESGELDIVARFCDARGKYPEGVEEIRIQTATATATPATPQETEEETVTCLDPSEAPKDRDMSIGDDDLESGWRVLGVTTSESLIEPSDESLSD